MAGTTSAQAARAPQTWPMRVFCMSPNQAWMRQALSATPVAWAVVVARMPSNPMRRRNPSQGGERNQKTKQTKKKEKTEPGQDAFETGDPGGVEGAGDSQKYAAADQDH